LSFQIFDVFGDIRFEGMDQVMGQLSNLGSGLSSLGGQITSFGGKLIDGISKPIVGLIEQGVTYNSTIENLQSSFAVMLGSEEKAVQMTEKLKEVGKETPFEVVGLAETTKTLLNYGYTQDNVIPTMMRLGDVSLGNEERFKGLALVMGQINGLGKLQAGDFNQLINRGWNPYNEIAKRTGETMAQFRERMRDGKVSSKEVEQALIDATSAGGMFYGGMEKGSQTLSGKISTLKDTFNDFLGSAVKPISEWLGNVLVPKLTQLGEYLGGLSEHTKMIILVVAGVVAAIGPLIAGFGILITVIGTVISAAGTIGGVLAALSPEIILIVGAIGAIVAVMAGVGVAIGYVLERTGALQATWSLLMGIFVIAKPIVMDLVNQGIDLLKQAFQFLKGVLDDVIPVVKPFLLDTILKARPIVMDIVRALGEFGKALLDNFSKKLDEAKKTWDAVWPVLKPIVIVTFDVIKTVVLTTLDVIKSIIKTATALIKGDWSAVWSNIGDIFSKIWAGILVVAKKQISFLTEVGKDIVQGLINGIKSMAGKAAEAMGKIVQSLPATVKKLLGISSPSKVFASIGENIMLGLSDGLSNTFPDVTKKISEMSLKLGSQFKVDVNESNNLKNAIISEDKPISNNISNVTNININMDIKDLEDVLTLDKFIKMIQVEAVARGAY